MYETLNSKDFDFLNEDDRELLNRVSAYSEKVLGEVSPEQMRISEQLDKLKPVMQELAEERKTSLENIFIQYMDLASLVLARKEEKFKEDMQDFNITEF